MVHIFIHICIYIFNTKQAVKELLADSRVDPQAAESSALRWACCNGHIEIVTVLLSDYRSETVATLSKAVGWASAFGHVEIVKLLMACGQVSWLALELDFFFFFFFLHV
jgi:hypothetical protein